MTLKKIQETESKFFNRKEYVFEYDSKGATPSKDTIRKATAGLTNIKEDLIVVKKINQKYGLNKASIKVNIYDSAENLKKAETINKKQKKKPEEKK